MDMRWFQLQRAVARAFARLRFGWSDTRERLASIDWLVIPPAGDDTYGSGTTGEAVTAWFTAWMRTVSVWSVVASLALVIAWIARGVLMGA